MTHKVNPHTSLAQGVGLKCLYYTLGVCTLNPNTSTARVSPPEINGLHTVPITHPHKKNFKNSVRPYTHFLLIYILHWI